MEYTIGSLADMISGSISKKKKTGVKDEKHGMKIDYQKISSVPLHKARKESKKRKLTEENGSPKKKKKVRITVPPADDYGSVEDDGQNIGDTSLVDSVPEAFNIATLESQENANAKHARKRLQKSGAVNDDSSKERCELDPEQEARTIFVGNLSNEMSKFNLKNLFRKFGKVECVRLRCAAVADPKTSKKLAVMKKEFHPERTNINGYVRFETTDSANKALALNGTVVREHTIRVDLAGGAHQHNPKNAVFVGNLQFAIEEEELHRMFQPCGKIQSIRLVRDNQTSMGKGFAYVNFEDSQAVELALKLDGEELGKRPLRVSRCQKKVKGSARDGNTTNGAGDASNGKVKKAKKKKIKPQPGAEFQGHEIDKEKLKKAKRKKRKKMNKGELKRKAMLSQLHINPKAPSKKMKESKKHV